LQNAGLGYNQSLLPYRVISNQWIIFGRKSITNQSSKRLNTGFCIQVILGINIKIHLPESVDLTNCFGHLIDMTVYDIDK